MTFAVKGITTLFIVSAVTRMSRKWKGEILSYRFCSHEEKTASSVSGTIPIDLTIERLWRILGTNS